MKPPSNINWPSGLDAQTFLNDYWQQKPLLIRDAFVDFETPISPDELAGLSLDEDTTPRLILQDADGQYQLENGPFAEDRFNSLDGNDWSLLVTDVEKHCPALADYLIPFQFIPNWRIDDLMISYAPEGASVGAHVDDYDVFLLQASGSRQWLIDSSANPDLSLVPDATLKLLANFHASETHTLAPGDMLYLPPGMPHHGIAASENCTTWSIGFRAPMLADVVHAFAEFAADKFDQQRYKDPALSVSTPGEINQQTLQAFAELWKQAVHFTDAQLAQLTGCVLTSPTIDVERDSYDANDVAKYHWQQHPFSRFAFIENENAVELFADSQSVVCSKAFAQALCSNSSLESSSLNDQDLLALHNLVRNGCLVPED